MSLCLNQPPVPTFAFLGANGTALTLPTLAPSALSISEATAGVQLSEKSPGQLTCQVSGADEILQVSIPAAGTYALQCDLAPGARLRVMLQSQLPEGTSAQLTLQGILQEKAQLQLYQIHTLQSHSQLVTQTHTHCHEQAKLELVTLTLGTGTLYDDVQIHCAGDGSCLEAYFGYLLWGAGREDRNMQSTHTGKRTDARIHAYGMLRDTASRLSRGTIDFQSGCAGSAGEETEETLLLGAHTHNVSLPVILCAEEDVAGEHGASIGRVDAAQMFYLQSRGLDTEQVIDTLSRACLHQVTRRLPPQWVPAILADAQEIEPGNEVST